MKSTLLVLGGTLAFLAPVAIQAAAREGLSDIVLQHEIHIARHFPQKPGAALLIILGQDNETRAVDGREILQFATVRLQKNGIRSNSVGSGFSADFVHGRLPPEQLLAPKLIVEVSADSSASGQFNLSCELNFITHRSKGKSREAFQAFREWNAAEQFHNVLGQDFEAICGKYLEKELPDFVRWYHKQYPKGAEVPSPNESAGSSSSGELSYKLTWDDSGNRRNHFSLGVTLGTPAIGNLHIGFWGSRFFPLVASLSGMYYDREHRGIEADIGWAFDNTGNVKQAIVLSVIGFNVTEQTTTQQQNIFGQVTSITTAVDDALHPYIGPSYIFSWRDFRAQAGAALRADSSSQTSFRFLIQVGYTPIFNF